MVDQFDFLSEKMINTLQKSLRLIRQSLKLGVQEFADLIGVTRQTVNNLESQKSQMSVTQFVAICSAIDYYTANSPQLRQIVYQFLQLDNDANNVFLRVDGSTNAPLSKRWFMLFENDVENNKSNLASKELTALTEDNGGAVCDFKFLVENCRIFLDDTILSDPLFESAANPLFEMAERNNTVIIVPFKAAEIVCGKNGNEHMRSEIGTRLLEQMKHRKILEVRGEKNDSNVAATLVSVFAKFKCQYRLALFTQDEPLANQILNLNGNAIGGFDISVYRLNQKGEFKSWSSIDGTLDIDSMDYFNDLETPTGESVSTEKFIGWDTI